MGIHHFFDGIYGSSPEAPHKADVIRQALHTHQLAPEQAIIIGDTKFDMMGAQETGIQKLAVTWGFGEQADLLNYHPDFIAHKTHRSFGVFFNNIDWATTPFQKKIKQLIKEQTRESSRRLLKTPL